MPGYACNYRRFATLPVIHNYLVQRLLFLQNNRNSPILSLILLIWRAGIATGFHGRHRGRKEKEVWQVIIIIAGIAEESFSGC